MFGKSIRKWFHHLQARFHSTKVECGLKGDDAVRYEDTAKYEFSPMTYQNPYIFCMYQILQRILDKRNILFQNLKLVLIDGETEKDDYDIQIVLSQLSNKLNYLMLVTDRPVYYQDFVDAMFEENGLIVQQLTKNAVKDIYGNFILDFERSSNLYLNGGKGPDIIYVPVYKKPWDICENLDIMVPVGYNTLVVNGIQLPISNDNDLVREGLFENKLDRLDQEFRKG